MVATTADHRAAAARLESACRAGALDDLLARLGVAVMTLFGSASRPGPLVPRDLDVGVLGGAGRTVDVVALADELGKAVGPAEIDVADLGRAGVVLRAEALTRCVPLYESDPGGYAEAQIAAVLERWDTDWLRELDLRAMAGRRKCAPPYRG